ncbi:39895_t:CDS:2 [Gigaspora margarita]|uniref:39895_t:CDS:1 n=1 Tax=Gigaspora margarita TaxID=4874 RepID=A0ABN7UHH6_GIGMA|nr:39895_t:CDS:2 [Gigaspora margarita]
MLFKISLCFLLILVVGTFPSLQLPHVTFPTNDSVLKSGDQVTIKFIDDGNPPTSSMSGIKIQFMKNQDTQQIPLLTIVENLPNTESQFDFKVPSIKALDCSPGKFYFLMFSDPGKPDKDDISCSPTFTVLEDSSETPSVTFPVKQMTPNNFLRGGIGDIGGIGIPVTTQKSAWPSVITASSIDPSKPITAIIPLYSPSDPSSDPGTVVIVVNGPKSTNTKLAASTFQPQKSPNDIGDIQSSSTVNSRFIKHGKIHCIIMRLGYILLSLLVMNIQYFGYF